MRLRYICSLFLSILLSVSFSTSSYAAGRTSLSEIPVPEVSLSRVPLSEILTEKTEIRLQDGKRFMVDVLKDANDKTCSEDLVGDDYNIDPSIYGICDDYNNLSWSRRAICEFALSCVGEIPYYFGGKSSERTLQGDNSFWQQTSPDHNGRTLKGLDCSSFVIFCYWTVLNERLGTWTGNITKDAIQIPEHELQPGDISLINTPGVKSNHTGIYVGRDSLGQPIWVHCSSSANTVVCQPYYSWHLYYRILP